MSTNLDSQHERLEYIRKCEKLSRTKFGLKLGKSEDAIYNLERDRAEIKPEFITLICDTFKIKLDWLEHGIGDMYDLSSEALDLGKVFNQIVDSSELTKIVSNLMNLSDKNKKIIYDLVELMSESEKK